MALSKYFYHFQFLSCRVLYNAREKYVKYLIKHRMGDSSKGCQLSKFSKMAVSGSQFLKWPTVKNYKTAASCQKSSKCLPSDNIFQNNRNCQNGPLLKYKIAANCQNINFIYRMYHLEYLQH